MTEKKIKILLVDDDAELRLLYAEVFQNANYEVLQASDGVEGLDLASREIPDVIFTGIVMPRMDGFSMIESLKKMVTTSNIPVVISSHMGREEDQKKANEIGAKDFIVRDMTSPVEVLRRIEAIFSKTAPEYLLKIDQNALDAQKLLLDFNFRDGFQCPQCKSDLVLKIKLANGSDKMFEAKFFCPKCGLELK
jgi:DNA-binding response OmpR family regulator